MARQRTATATTERDESTGDGGSAATSETSGRPGAARAKKPLLLAALVLALCAAGAAGWGGWQRYQAANDDSASFAQARDDALAAGEQAVQNMNTWTTRRWSRARQLGTVHHGRSAPPTRGRA